MTTFVMFIAFALCLAVFLSELSAIKLIYDTSNNGEEMRAYKDRKLYYLKINGLLTFLAIGSLSTFPYAIEALRQNLFLLCLMPVTISLLTYLISMMLEAFENLGI